MIGETFRDHFLFFRAGTLLVAALGLFLVWRLRSARLGLLTVTALGWMSWLYTVGPLSRPFGLQPGSLSAFEMALASSGAARGDVGDSFVVGRGHPRPLLGLLWNRLAGGSVERVAGLYSLLGLAAIVFLVLCVIVSIRASGLESDSSWLALSCAFTGVFAASVPLDAFRPFGLFHRSFFLTPHRALALGFSLVALALVWKRRRWSVVSGIGLGLVGWIDLNLLAWGVFSLIVFDVLGAIRERRFAGLHGFAAAALAGAISSPQVASLFRSELLVRGLSSDTVSEYTIAFRDVSSITTDMGWVFFLAVAAAAILWKEGLRGGQGLLSLLVSSCALWAFAAIGIHRGLIFEPDEPYQILRFSFALLSGVAAHRMVEWLCRNRARFLEGPLRGLAARLGEGPSGPLSFLLVVVVLGATSAPILWHPLRQDPDYFVSMERPIAEHDERLASFILSETRPEEVVLSGPITSEWVAVLTGRRVRNGIFVLPRDERRRLRRDLEALFLSEDPAAMRAALSRLGASIVVVDDSLLELYPDFSEERGVLERAAEIDDRYVIYRVR